MYGYKKASFAHGFAWGGFAFSCYFFWFLILLLQKSLAAWWMAVIGYLVVVAYFSLSSGIVGALLARRGRWGQPIIIVGYYIFLHSYSLIPIGMGGLPFFNAALPLVEYAWAQPVIRYAGVITRAYCLGRTSIGVGARPEDIDVVHIKPLSLGACDACALGQRIFYHLSALQEGRQQSPVGRRKPYVLVAPESFFPFCVNRYPELVSLWGGALDDEALLIIGTHAVQEEKQYQAAVVIQKGLINKVYVKHHAVSFVEALPPRLQKYAWLASWFVSGQVQWLHAGKGLLKEQGIVVDGEYYIMPFICSEFFFKCKPFKVWHHCINFADDKTSCMMVLINDSWFVGYFKELLRRYAQFMALFTGVPVVYVGHTDLVWLAA